MSQASKVMVVRRSTAIIILVIIFGFCAAILGGFIELQRLHRFDKNQDLHICLGANDQVKKYVDALTAPTPIPPEASPAERAATEARNQRVSQNLAQLEQIYNENRIDCQTDFLAR